MTPLTVLPVEGLPEIAEGDDLAALISAATELRDGDVVVVAQKVVSKAEGAVVDPPEVSAGEDPRRVLARSLAAEVVADSPWALIVRTQHGFVCANAGVDASNVPGGKLTLLPDDPDASARALRAGLRAEAGVDVAVIISDTFGRPWRVGQTDVAIGVAGLQPIRDERGRADRDGTLLTVTEPAIADELAGAADLVRDKAAGVPVVVVRGLVYEPAEDAGAVDLVRNADTDLFARGRGMLAAQLERAWSDDIAPLDAADLEAVARVAPAARLRDTGPPTILEVDNGVGAGLAVAVLADRGAFVRWSSDGGAVVVEGARPAPVKLA